MPTCAILIFEKVVKAFNHAHVQTVLIGIRIPDLEIILTASCYTHILSAFTLLGLVHCPCLN